MIARGIDGVAVLLALGGATAAPAELPTAPPTREEVQRAAPGPAPLAPSRLTVEGGPGAPPCPLDAPALAGTRLVLKRVEFDHLAGLEPAALAPAYADSLGTAVPPARACAIRDAAARILADAGYVAAVQVPAQTIVDGTLHLDVVMARLVRIELGAHQGRAAARIAARLAALTRQPVFNVRAAERALVAARDLPGYDVHLALRPADGAPGEVIGVLTVTRLPLLATANLQNYGGHAIGRWGAALAVQANDLLGIGDRLSLGVFNTLQVHEQTVLQGGYELRPGASGLVLATRVTYAWTRPDLGGGLHPLDSRTLVASAEAGYPLWRTGAGALRVYAGADLIDQGLDYLGRAYSRDRLRVAFARLDGSVAAATTDAREEPRWHATGTLELRHGLGVLGASPECGRAPLFAGCPVLPTPSRLQGDARAGLVRFVGEGAYRVVPLVTVAVAARAQYAFAPLLSYEQFSGGAYTIGRGYDPGAIVGDIGAGGSAELRLGRLLPTRANGFAVQPFGFVDAAWARERDAVFERRGDHLLSTGGGVRVAWSDRARLDATVAVPLRRTADETYRGSTRVLLTLTTRLVPWR